MSSKAFDLIDFEELSKAVDIMKSIPPSIEHVEIYSEGFEVLKRVCDDNKPSYVLPFQQGIDIVLKNHIEDVERNECKILFSDGSYKIIPVFKII